MKVLPAKQQKAVASLLAKPTLKDAATDAGISETTLWRWLQEEDFRQVYQQARSRMLEGTLANLAAAGPDAVAVLKNIMADATATPAARVSAARAVLEFLIRSQELLEVEARLRALEARLTNEVK